MQTASVVVVSHGRPDALERCLVGLAQIDHPNCEFVVVADAASVPAVGKAGLDGQIKLVPFETQNISAARNAGIQHAAGDIVAFIDDDAVPEPAWLRHLTAPFADPEVQATGGFVRGRNGISFQWRGRVVFGDARAVDLPLPDDAPHAVQAAKGRGVKTEGTNMAVRRSTLVQVGGFDEAFAFYLDETDLNMRLAQQSAVTTVVPLAQVHHGVAASARRTSDRVPRDLFQIGASLAVFLRKHSGLRQPVADGHRADQRRRLLNHLVTGRLMPGDVRRVLSTFDAGWKEGMKRRTGQTARFDACPEFLRFPTLLRPHEKLTCRFWQAGKARKAAAQMVRDGNIVSLFIWSPTTLYHRVRFTPDGVWEQSGGQFGRSDRSDPLFQIVTSKARTLREMRRLYRVRVPKP